MNTVYKQCIGRTNAGKINGWRYEILSTEQETRKPYSNHAKA